LVTALVFALAIVAFLWVVTAAATLWIEARYPPTGKRVEVGGGAAVHILDQPAQGAERGAVMMIHGASGNAADMSVALAGRLSQAGFRVLSVDRPGHGWSGRVGGPGGSSPTLQAEALRRAAQSLGIGQAIVVGHSLGAITGLAMTLEAPGFVRALVLVSPVSHPWPGGVAWYYLVGAHPWLGPPFRRLIALPAAMTRMPGGIKAVFAPNAAPAGYIERTRLPLLLRPLHFRSNCEDVAYAEVAVKAQSTRYGEIQAPTEIVTGDCDGVVYAHIHSTGCARDIPGARLTTLEGVGHAPHHVTPERIVAIILDAERRAVERETAKV
jgi:pimeloyl-ACP methyl ester carboxylesterase